MLTYIYFRESVFNISFFSIQRNGRRWKRQYRPVRSKTQAARRRMILRNGLYRTPKWCISQHETGLIVSQYSLYRKPKWALSQSRPSTGELPYSANGCVSTHCANAEFSRFSEQNRRRCATERFLSVCDGKHLTFYLHKFRFFIFRYTPSAIRFSPAPRTAAGGASIWNKHKTSTLLAVFQSFITTFASIDTQAYQKVRICWLQNI